MNKRLEQLKTELARRIGPVLPDVPVAQFEELIDAIAWLQYTREPRSQTLPASAAPAAARR